MYCMYRCITTIQPAPCIQCTCICVYENDSYNIIHGTFMSHTASPQVFLLIGPLCRLDDSHLVFKLVLSIVLAVVTPELVGYL